MRLISYFIARYAFPSASSGDGRDRGGSPTATRRESPTGTPTVLFSGDVHLSRGEKAGYESLPEHPDECRLEVAVEDGPGDTYCSSFGFGGSSVTIEAAETEFSGPVAC